MILRQRGYLEAYLQRYPAFGQTLTPWHLDGPAPEIVRDMAAAGKAAGVGPMAAVAGAIAEQVGRGLLSYSQEVIVENGGDVFLQVNRPMVVGIYAGRSPLSMQLGLRIDTLGQPVAVCTSSGTVGHSLSLGCADAVCVLSASCPLADAVATAVGNRVGDAGEVENAVDFGKQIPGISGLMVIKDGSVGFWGDLEIVALGEKKVEF